jgi:RimJ/RimL family protein N-acetyltransferase
MGEPLILEGMEETAWPVIEGEGCTLAVLSLDDAPEWQAGEDAEILRWFEFPHPSPMENVVAAITNWRTNWLQDGPMRQWGIWVDDRLAGGVELQDRGDRRANLSYVVFPEFRRRGVADEAIRLATSWALCNMPVDAVVAIIDMQNKASRAAAERSGFVLEGLAERWEYDEWGPSVRYVFPAK